MAAEEIRIRIEGRAGRITLTRPDALNALTHDMALAMEEALIAWRDDAAVDLVLIDAEGDRAFCAGGDIELLYETGRSGDYEYGRRFWRDEYRLNAMIAEYPKPYVSLMQGFVMGGGVGIGCHGSHRIVCETTKVAMPECSIGLIPDVGGSYLLARAPDRAGWYLGLTGARIAAADAIFAGFADAHVARESWPELVSALCDSGDVSKIADHAVAAGEATLPEKAEIFRQHFSGSSALDCLNSLEGGDNEWTADAVKSIRRACPLSVACTHELLEMSAKAGSVREALQFEYRFTARSMSHGEFLEGVRAQIIDKDRNPQWRTSRLEEVTDAMISTMLAPWEGTG